LLIPLNYRLFKCFLRKQRSTVEKIAVGTILQTKSTHLSIHATLSDDRLKLFIDLKWADTEPEAASESEATPEDKESQKRKKVPRTSDPGVLYTEVLSSLGATINKERLNTAVILHAVKQLI